VLKEIPKNVFLYCALYTVGLSLCGSCFFLAVGTGDSAVSCWNNLGKSDVYSLRVNGFFFFMAAIPS